VRSALPASRRARKSCQSDLTGMRLLFSFSTAVSVPASSAVNERRARAPPKHKAATAHAQTRPWRCIQLRAWSGGVAIPRHSPVPQI